MNYVRERNMNKESKYRDRNSVEWSTRKNRGKSMRKSRRKKYGKDEKNGREEKN